MTAVPSGEGDSGYVESPPENEQERLRRVYNRYERDSSFTARHDPRTLEKRLSLRRFERDAGPMLESRIRNLDRLRVLDAGSGDGHMLGWLSRAGAHNGTWIGVDLLRNNAARAKARHPDVEFVTADLRSLPFSDDQFDLVICSTLYSSIVERNVAFAVASEIRRVLRSPGTILWYDIRYNNPANPDVRGWTRDMIKELFPNGQLKLRTTRLLPPIARRLGVMTPVLYPLLHSIPVLRSSYVGTIDW